MSDASALGRLLLVTGEVGVDPHPVARAVAARLDRAVHVDLEALQQVVVSGAVTTPPHPADPVVSDPAVVEQVFLRWLAGIAVGETYQRAGFDAVLSERVSGELLDDLLDFVDPSPVHLVVLQEQGPTTGAARAGGPRGPTLAAGTSSSPQLATLVLDRLDEALVDQGD